MQKKSESFKSSTIILHVAAIILLPLQLLFSIFLLLRGHDEPGGGFIAGLVASSAFVLYLFSHGVAATRELIRLEPHSVVGCGLLFGTLAAFPALLVGDPIFTAQWLIFNFAEDTEIKLSTVLLFDLGVYLVVLGSIMTIVISLTEAEV